MNKADDIRGILWLKLHPASKHRLHQVYPPKYDDIFYDHVTLAFDVAQSEVKKYIGRPASAMVYAYAANQNVEAVRVTTHDLPDTYGVPHITLSTKNGIKAFESVAMLKGEHDETPATPPFTVDGVIEFIPLNTAQL